MEAAQAAEAVEEEEEVVEEEEELHVLIRGVWGRNVNACKTL